MYNTMMRGGNRHLRRMMDKMGLDMNEIHNVKKVVITTDKKEIIINNPSVTEMKAKNNSIFQIVATDLEEKELETPTFSNEDIMIVCQQAHVNEDKAISALTESNGDLAQAILLLTTK